MVGMPGNMAQNSKEELAVSSWNLALHVKTIIILTLISLLLGM